MPHSASSITLADRCDRAWWHRYRDKLKPPELTWKQVKRMKARGDRLPADLYGNVFVLSHGSVCQKSLRFAGALIALVLATHPEEGLVALDAVL